MLNLLQTQDAIYPLDCKDEDIPARDQVWCSTSEAKDQGGRFSFVVGTEETGLDEIPACFYDDRDDNIIWIPFGEPWLNSRTKDWEIKVAEAPVTAAKKLQQAATRRAKRKAAEAAASGPQHKSQRTLRSAGPMHDADVQTLD